MHHPMPVRVVDDLGDLGDELELLLEGKCGPVVGEPQVQPQFVLGLQEHQTDAEFLVLDDVNRHLQAVVLEPREQLVFVFDAACPGVFLRGGRAGFGQVEADTRLPLHVDVVERGPVLPAFAVAEGLFVDHPGAEFPLPARGWLAQFLRTERQLDAAAAEQALNELPVELGRGLTRGQAEDLAALCGRERIVVKLEQDGKVASPLHTA